MGNRQLRDLGGYLALLFSRPLLAFWFNRNMLPSEKATTPGELRSWTRDMPRNATDVQMANMVRILGWASLLVVSVLCVAPLALLTASDRPRSPALVVVLTTLAAVSMFAAGAGMASGFRLAVASSSEGRLNRALRGERSADLLLWLCRPSNADLLFALVWASCFTPLLFESIAGPAG